MPRPSPIAVPMVTAAPTAIRWRRSCMAAMAMVMAPHTGTGPAGAIMAPAVGPALRQALDRDLVTDHGPVTDHAQASGQDLVLGRDLVLGHALALGQDRATGSLAATEGRDLAGPDGNEACPDSQQMFLGQLPKMMLGTTA